MFNTIITGDSGNSLLGDGLFQESAIRAYAQKNNTKINLVLNGPARQLFLEHPNISLCEENCELPITGKMNLTCNYAFNSSANRQRHICEGYFFRLGLNPKDYDTKPRLYGEGLGPEPLEDDKSEKRIFIAPFSASCSVHNTGVANKTIGLDWWYSLTNRLIELGYSVVSLGNKDEPLLAGTDNWRGKPLREVAREMRNGKLLIAGDTGITAISGALNMDIVLLSAALPTFLTGPQTLGHLEIIESSTPPSWKVEDVITAVVKILDKQNLEAIEKELIK